MSTAPVKSSPRERGNVRHLGAGAALSVVADVAALVAAAAVSVVLGRAIGPSANGKFALLLTLENVTVLVCSLGLSAGITYQVSHGNWQVKRAFSTSMISAIVLGLIGTAGGLGVYVALRHSALRSVPFPLVAIALGAIPAVLAWQFISTILLARDRYESYAGVQIVYSSLILVGAAGLALLFRLTGAVAGMAAAGVLAALTGGVLLHRLAVAEGKTRGPAEQDSGIRHLREAFRFGLQAWAANIVQQANYRLDLLVLGGYAAASHVGVYSVAVTITATGWILPHGIQTVLFPRAAKLDAAARAGDLTAEESDAAVTRAIRHSVLLLLPSGLIVAALLGLVPLVFGGRFSESVALGFVLLPGVLVLGVGKVVGSVVSGRGSPRYMLYSGSLGGVVTIALYFIMIPRYHEWGASIASTMSYALTTMIVLGFFRRLTRIALRSALVPTRDDVRNYLEAILSLRSHLRSRGGHHVT